MKKNLLRLWISLSVLIVFTLCAKSVVAQSSVFSEDSIYGNAESYTTPFDSANWEVSEIGGDMRYILNNSSINPHHPSGNPWFDPDGPEGPLNGGAESALAELSVVTGKTFANFEMTVDVSKPEFENENGNYDLALVFGYIDENNYCYVNLNGKTSENDNNFAAVVDGTGLRGTHPEALVEIPLGTVLSDNDWHAVKLVREDSTIKCYYDGLKILDLTDAAYAKEGAIGVGSWNDAAYFDNIAVSTVTISGLNNIISTTIGILENNKIMDVGVVTAADLLAALTISANASAVIVDEADAEVSGTTEVTDLMKVRVTAENGEIRDYAIEVGSPFVCNLEVINVYDPMVLDSVTGIFSIETGADVAIVLSKLKTDATSTEKVVDADGNEVAGDVLWDETFRYVITGDCGEAKEYEVQLVAPTYPIITIQKVTTENPVVIDAYFDEWAEITEKYDLLVPDDAEKGLPDTNDLSSYFKAAWDDQYLYIYLNVTDNNISTSASYSWENDGIELAFIMASDIAGRSSWNLFWHPETQPGNHKLGYVYGNTFAQAVTQGGNAGTEMRDYNGAILEMWNKEDGTSGYEVEMQLPWTALNGIDNPNPVVIEDGATFSMNLSVNDNDGAGLEDVIYWAVENVNGSGTKYGKVILNDDDVTVGNNELLSRHLNIYPNPVADRLMIRGEKELQRVSIININGQIVRTFKVDGSSEISIPTNDLHSGMYMLSITTIDENVTNVKLVKQ